MRERERERGVFILSLFGALPCVHLLADVNVITRFSHFNWYTYLHPSLRVVVFCIDVLLNAFSFLMAIVFSR